MLLVVCGSSGAGKTTALSALPPLPRLAMHDFDEVEAPTDVDAAWRHRTLERWIVSAVERERQGTDVLLTAQSPIGEVLAAPSATDLQGIAVCLLDVDDRTRVTRLRTRDGDRWSPDEIERFIGWAAWHREHAADPRRRPEVITAAGWSSWNAGDPRWTVPTIDTTSSPPDVVGRRLGAWITAARRSLADGTLPLARGWTR